MGNDSKFDDLKMDTPLTIEVERLNKQTLSFMFTLLSMKQLDRENAGYSSDASLIEGLRKRMTDYRNKIAEIMGD